MRVRYLGALCALSVGGCQFVKDVKDTVEGVFEPIVAVGVVTVLDPPESELVDLDALGLTVGVAATVFLADARDVDELEQAPVVGATLVARACGEEATIPEEADGTYAVVPSNPLDGCRSTTIEVVRTDVDPSLYAPVPIPAPPGFTIPERWTAGEDLVIPLAGTQFDSALVVVMDAGTGDVVFSNEPEGIRGYYDFLMGTGTVEDVVVPGATFAEDSTYALLVTGLVKTPNRDVEEANTVLTVLDGGRTRLYALTTVALP